MSTSTPGRGKQRKHGQDLNTNSHSMGGGHGMTMPPNGGATFVTPIAHQANHAPEYVPRTATGGAYEPHFMAQPPVSGLSSHTSMILPQGASIQSEQPSQYAMQTGMNTNMNRPMNQNMQWQGVPNQHYGQQQQHMNRGAPPQGGRPAYQQPAQAQMGYNTAYGMMPQNVGYNVYSAPNMYQQYAPEQQPQWAYQQQIQQIQMQQTQQWQAQQHTAGGPATMQAPPSLQQQNQQGAPTGGPAPAPQQQAPMHGGPQHAPAGAQPMHQGSMPGQGPNSYNNQAPMQQQPRPAGTALPTKKRNVLPIVNPATNETVNQKDLEESKEDAPKAEKEEAKGTDEMDSAAPQIKRQFADQILEQETTKAEQPAPARAPAPATKWNKCLFTPAQMTEMGVKANAPVSAAPEVPVVAAPAQEQKQNASEYIPERTPEPAYPNNYKEAQAKEATPEHEISATNNDEHQIPDDNAHHEDPASSSSEKNTSNDSAICVQTPLTTPPPKDFSEKEVENEETTPVAITSEEPAVKKDEKESIEVEPPIKKLEQLVIPESESQEEVESEPTTPAPVTPSVSETAATLAEEEEDAEKAAAAEKEKIQRKRAELEASIAKNLEDPEQVNVELGRYNREYLYNVRDLERLCSLTDCPLNAEELKNFGICRSQVSNEPKRKQDGQCGFNPPWMSGGRAGPRDNRPSYKGRPSEPHRSGPAGNRGSNKKLPPTIRPSIERRVESNVQLHKAEKAWKPEKTSEADLADEEAQKKLLLKTIRSLFNKITPTTKDALIQEFLGHKVYQSSALNDVISIIFDKAVEEPKFCPLYSNMCMTQVNEELRSNNNVSLFRNAILARAQDTFATKNLDDFVKEKEDEIAAEADEKKKKEKQIELLEAKSKFRRRKFGNITFIGQLYLQNLMSVRIILFCVVDLLKSVTDKPANLEGYEADDESVDCAVRLLETIGKRLEDSNNSAKAAAAATSAQGAPRRQAPPPTPAQQPFPLDLTFKTLEEAAPFVSSRIKFMILNLLELRKNFWKPRKTADAGPKKLDEIKKDIQKEQMENAQQQQQYERKQSRQEAMGGRGSMGGHGGNPKRQIIQRNSQDNRGTLQDRRSQAEKAVNLQKSTVQQKKASLSSVTGTDRSSLGGREKSKWSGGASGGSENSKKEDRAAAIQSTSRFMGNQRSSSSASMKGAEDEGASASGTTTQANSEDEREQNELREKQDAEIAKRCALFVDDYCTGEINLDGVRDDVLKIVGDEKFSKPNTQTVFKGFLAGAVKKGATAKDSPPKFGHVLAYCVQKKTDEKDSKGKEEIFKGLAESCRSIVEQEQWDDVPKIWDIIAEVLISAHLPPEGLFEGGSRPILTDFKDAFLNAAKDTRKPYALFVLVLKRLAEKHKDDYMEMASWVMDECESITKHMDVEKLDKALTDTMTEFDKNLHVIFRQDH